MKNSLAEMNKSLFRSVTVSTKVSVECDERLNSWTILIMVSVFETVKCLSLCASLE